MKARCKYCHGLSDVEQMHKDKITEDLYHLSCSISLSRRPSRFGENNRRKKAKNETIRDGLAKAAQNGKKVGRPRKEVVGLRIS